METSVASRQAREAGTIAEAFRITAAQRADEPAVRDRHGTLELTWGELRDARRRARGRPARARRRARRDGRDHADQPARVPPRRPRGRDGRRRRRSRSTRPTRPTRSSYVVEDSGAKVVITEQAYLPVVLEARKGLPGVEHVILIDPPADGAPEGTIALADVEGSNPDFDAEAAVAAMSPEDVLTLIYTSGTTGPAEGRRARAPQPHHGGLGHRGDRQLPARLARRLLAAGRAHRRARRAPLPADRVRHHDHDLRGPAPGDERRCRRSARSGSSPCRGSGRS